MRRRHMISQVQYSGDDGKYLNNKLDYIYKEQHRKTMCGHDMTDQEYRFAKNRKWHHVNCKRCLAQR